MADRDGDALLRLTPALYQEPFAPSAQEAPPPFGSSDRQPVLRELRLRPDPAAAQFAPTLTERNLAKAQTAICAGRSLEPRAGAAGVRGGARARGRRKAAGWRGEEAGSGASGLMWAIDRPRPDLVP